MKNFKRYGFTAAMVGILAMALSFSGCASLKTWWGGKAEPALAKAQAALQPLIPQAQKTLKAIQADYPFWAGIVQGTLNIAGIKVTLPPASTVLPYIQLADTSLAVLGQVNAESLNGQPISLDPGLVQNAILQASQAAPEIKAKLLSDPALKAAYDAWTTQQANPTTALMPGSMPSGPSMPPVS